MKLPGHPLGRDKHAELPGKVFAFHIVPLAPAYKAGLTGHVPITTQIDQQEG